MQKIYDRLYSNCKAVSFLDRRNCMLFEFQISLLFKGIMGQVKGCYHWTKSVWCRGV